MWKSQATLCTFSPEAVAAYLPTSYTESIPSRPLKSRTSRQVSSSNASHQCPSGMMSQHSEATTKNVPKSSASSSNTEMSLSFAEGFLARTSALREKAKAYLERVAGYGLSTFASFAKFDRGGCLPKIVQCSLFGDSIEYSVDFPRSGIMRRGKCYQLPPWVAVIGENGSGLLAEGAIDKLWATPTVFGDNNFKGASKKSGDGLATQVKAESVSDRPTPTAHAAKKLFPNEKNRDGLNYAVIRGAGKDGLRCFWSARPTQTRTDVKYAIHGNTQRAKCLGAMARHGELDRHNQQLNPDWVEWIMNWPIGWTDPKAKTLMWLLPEEDPADMAPEHHQHIPRTTLRTDYRTKRIVTLGNGQVPLCAYAAMVWGLAILSIED